MFIVFSHHLLQVITQARRNHVNIRRHKGAYMVYKLKFSSAVVDLLVSHKFGISQNYSTIIKYFQLYTISIVPYLVCYISYSLVVVFFLCHVTYNIYFRIIPDILNINIFKIKVYYSFIDYNYIIRFGKDNKLRGLQSLKTRGSNLFNFG